MVRSYTVQHQRPRFGKLLVILVLLSYLMTTGACGGDAQVRQQATDSQQRYTQLLKRAHTIGVPVNTLQPILHQEQQLKSTSAPGNPFDDGAIDAYYQGLDTSYASLATQVQTLIDSSLGDTRSQAQKTLDEVKTTLKTLSAKKLPAQNFSNQVEQLQDALPAAKLPRDVTTIESQTQTLHKTLLELAPLSDHLRRFDILIAFSEDAKLDASTLKSNYKTDAQAFKQVDSLEDVHTLEQQLRLHQQGAMTLISQAIPRVTTEKLQAFEQLVQQLPQQGVDAVPHQKKLDAARALVTPAMSVDAYLKFARQINTDMDKANMALLRGEGTKLLRSFHQDVTSWGRANAVYAPYNNTYYPLSAGYMPQGIGSNLDEAIEQGTSVASLQDGVDSVKTIQFLFQMMKKDARDATAYNAPHQADREVLQHFGLRGQVVVISLAKQALRVYQNGQLVHSAYVTTGRYELPTLPGVFNVLNRESPTRFKSPFPRTSPYWYPPTNINHAVMFHAGGYFIHDSWWRANYGPGTQFPHADASGDQQSSGNGSHGCVNLPSGEASWFFYNTGWNTKIVIY